MYKRNHSFRMNIMEEIFEIMSRSCVEIVVNSKTIDTTYQLID